VWTAICTRATTAHLDAGVFEDLDAGAADQRVRVRHPNHHLRSTAQNTQSAAFAPHNDRVPTNLVQS
jgi:hypothetical protein